MKALILAAGLGTRLLPYTDYMPKPLFSVCGQPVLDIIIRLLQHADCKGVIINTHHLHHKIDSFISRQQYFIPVYTRYEPAILGTGGAIKNAADFFDGQPFMVINSDIVTDIDLREVCSFHLNHNYPATLVLHDRMEFNSVSVNHDDFITDFGNQPKALAGSHVSLKNNDLKKNGIFEGIRNLAFTGIQVLDPEVIDFIPDNLFSNSIDSYRKMISKGKKIKAFISKKRYWNDIGTPARYKKTVVDKMAPKAFKLAWPDYRDTDIHQTELKGDGSDRRWHRLVADSRSLIMADHGIRTQSSTLEVDSFAAIGRHLQNRGVPVPKIYLYDTFSGLVFMEDLGDLNLQTVIKKAGSKDKIIDSYKSVITLLVKLSICGARGFEPSWTYQTRCYNSDFILKNECRYFVDAFLKGFLKMDLNFETFQNEFNLLACRAVENSVNGFMHRDMQSRNIMVKNNDFYFIDFQGGRFGPIQYDLASLLIDPYVELPDSIQNRLLDYCIKKLSDRIEFDRIDFDRVDFDRNKFKSCYKYCAITRNLQILGAFGYLAGVKGKTAFRQYIPAALKTLQHNLFSFENNDFPVLKSIVKKITSISA